jgi:hypothetical protein
MNRKGTEMYWHNLKWRQAAALLPLAIFYSKTRHLWRVIFW